MTTVIQPQEFILDRLTAYIASKDGLEIATDSIINDCLTELIKLQMREIAGATDRPRHWVRINPLDEAIANVQSILVKGKPQAKRLLEPFEESIRTKLKRVAKEMTMLSEMLQTTRRKENVLARQQVLSDVEVPFEVISIGTQQHLDGFVVRPLMTDTFSLNLESVEGFATVTGEWFPYQIENKTFVFVVDDDGTIFISTENFPETLVSDALEAIKNLARRLYKSADEENS
jgi:hypothetical protein